MKIDKDYLNHLVKIRNDFYNRGFNQKGKKVQEDIDKLYKR